jgi:hypothetical protein
MPQNPYLDELNNTFRGTRVRVHAGGHTYEGWARVWEFSDQSIILYDAVRDDGEQLGGVTLRNPTIVERLTPTAPIETVPLDTIVESPYSTRTFGDDDQREFVKLTRQRGHLLTFPTVRPLDDETWTTEDGTPADYEIAVGHRRVDTARRAGLETLPVRIRDLDDWEAVQWFVDDHIPIPEANESGMYTQSEIDRAIPKLRERWPDEKLLTLDPLAPFLREKLATTRRGHLQHGAGADAV